MAGELTGAARSIAVQCLRQCIAPLVAHLRSAVPSAAPDAAAAESALMLVQLLNVRARSIAPEVAGAEDLDSAAVDGILVYVQRCLSDQAQAAANAAAVASAAVSLLCAALCVPGGPLGCSPKLHVALGTALRRAGTAGAPATAQDPLLLAAKQVHDAAAAAAASVTGGQNAAWAAAVAREASATNRAWQTITDEAETADATRLQTAVRLLGETVARFDVGGIVALLAPPATAQPPDAALIGALLISVSTPEPSNRPLYERPLWHLARAALLLQRDVAAGRGAGVAWCADAQAAIAAADAAAAPGISDAVKRHVTSMWAAAVAGGAQTPLSLWHDAQSLVDIPGLPSAEALEPPTARRWPTVHVATENGRAVAVSERYVLETARAAPFEAAMTYIDLLAICDYAPQRVTALTNALLWLYADFKARRAAALRGGAAMHEALALKAVILRLATTLMHVAYELGSAPDEVAANRVAVSVVYDVLVRAGAEGEESGLTMMLSRLARSTRVCVALPPPAVLVRESLVAHVRTRGDHEQLVAELRAAAAAGARLPFPVSVLDYYVFQAAWKRGDAPAASAARTKLMETLLAENGWAPRHLHANLARAHVPRSPAGYSLARARLQGRGGEGWGTLRGFTIVKATGELQLLAEAFSGVTGPLVFPEDVAAHLRLPTADPEPHFFSLDQPDVHLPLHPCQLMRFAPTALADTAAMHTYLHTDYLLKEFAAGVAVSAHPPFELMRLADSPTFAGLPAALRHRLRPIHERGNQSVRMQRLWIQADEMGYRIVDTAETLTMLLDDPAMTVRCKPMLPGAGLEAADTDVDEFGRPIVTPAMQFAADLTGAYASGELGAAYPEFSRLRELTKLAILPRFVGMYRSAIAGRAALDEDAMRGAYRETIAERRRAATAQVASWATSVRAYGYPKAGDAVAHQARLEQAVAGAGVPLYSVPYAQKQELLAKIREQAAEADARIVTDLEGAVVGASEALAVGGGWAVSHASARAEISLFVRNPSGRTTTLVDLLLSAAPGQQAFFAHCQGQADERKTAQRAAFEACVSGLVGAANRVAPRARPNDGCLWVPSAFSAADAAAGEVRLVYGGVLLAPRLYENGGLGRRGAPVAVRAGGFAQMQTPPPPPPPARPPGGGGGAGGGSSGNGGGSDGGSRGGGGSSGGGAAGPLWMRATAAHLQAINARLNLTDAAAQPTAAAVRATEVQRTQLRTLLASALATGSAMLSQRPPPPPPPPPAPPSPTFAQFAIPLVQALQPPPGADARHFERKRNQIVAAISAGAVPTEVTATSSERSSVTRAYRRAFLSRVERLYGSDPAAVAAIQARVGGMDVDHRTELQLGGENGRGNLAMLQASVNRSFGSSLQRITRLYRGE